MKSYIKVPDDKVYRLLNTGAIILVCTDDGKNHADMAPIAWYCPLEMDPVTRLLMVCDNGHKTYANIRTTGKFVICIPHASQVHLVRQLGSVSGHKVNKIEHFKLHTFISHEHKYSLLYGCIAYLECKFDKVTNAEGIIIATVASARADKLAFRNRFLVEKEEGKILHHLGGEKFMLPGDQVIE